jgi:catechol 2,3-dioxygenase-like lactoylglutathione lyase family enzyme
MRFDHVGVVVEDLEAACAFARDVLGLGAPATEFRVDEFGLTAAFFGLGSGRLELVRFDAAGERLPPGEPVRLDHIAVEVDDLEAEAARLSAQGVCASRSRSGRWRSPRRSRCADAVTSGRCPRRPAASCGS